MVLAYASVSVIVYIDYKMVLERPHRLKTLREIACTDRGEGIRNHGNGHVSILKFLNVLPQARPVCAAE
jgi:hypothetical protein